VARRYEDDCDLTHWCVKALAALCTYRYDCILVMSKGDFSIWLAAITVVAASYIKSVSVAVHVVKIFLRIFFHFYALFTELLRGFSP
jgi:hypothetical protein